MAKKKTSSSGGRNGKGKDGVVTITRPNERIVIFRVKGTTPYVQEKFSEKAKEQMRAKQAAGGVASKSRKREPKDFEAYYQGSQYKPIGETWKNGAIPATAIKAAMINACRLVDFKMTDSKQCVFVEQDGYDADDRIPLIKITKGKPQRFEQALPNTNGGHDIRIRPVWDPGWEAIVRIRYDADRFTADDVGNLLLRAGHQVGIGAGRHASRKCAGIGWGSFTIVSQKSG